MLFNYINTINCLIISYFIALFWFPLVCNQTNSNWRWPEERFLVFSYRFFSARPARSIYRRIELTTCTRNFFMQNNIYKWIPVPENCKNQETNRIKSKKINSPGNLSHFKANLETNCNSFYFSTVLFYEVPRLTY